VANLSGAHAPVRAGPPGPAALLQPKADGVSAESAQPFARRYNPLMPHIEKHLPGSFDWIELTTTDQNSAGEFYCALPVWASYTRFALDGRSVAGCYPL
jgi:hypothetical protein